MYYTFQTKNLDECLAQLVNDLRNKGVTVGTLYKALLKVKQYAKKDGVETFKVIRKLLLEEAPNTTDEPESGSFFSKLGFGRKKKDLGE